MDYIELIGLSAGFFLALSLLPQVLKSYKTKKTKDLSIHWLLINILAQVLWAIYGFIKGSLSLIVTSVVVSIMSFLLIFLKKKYG